MSTFHVSNYVDLKQCRHAKIFDETTYVWQAIGRIADYLKKLFAEGCERAKGENIGEFVYVGKGTVIEPGARIQGPAWIGENCLIRHGAYVRENVIVGDGALLGNSCEFKNSFLANETQVPHFSYVGDSILGYQSHLGAGVILSNLKLDRSHIQIRHDGELIDTGLKKFGAIVGDGSEVGCNSVLNPGSILGRKCLLYAGTMWKGVLAEGSIAKAEVKYHIVQRHRRSS